MCKISFIDLYSELKARVLPISRGIIIDIKRTHTHTHLSYIRILIQKQSLEVFNEKTTCTCKFTEK